MGINLTQTGELKALREAIIFLELVQMIEDALQSYEPHHPPDLLIDKSVVTPLRG